MLALVSLCFISLAHKVAPPLQDPIESKVNQTLSQMTVDEKIDLLTGVKGFYCRGVPRLGVPELKMSDGPAGVRNDGPTTAYPAGVCMAATFDSDLATAFGTGIGRDARSRADHIWLGPGVNLARVPQNGRDFEYFGEDPYLSGQMAAHVIQGVQRQGVVATVKHYAANNHENDRMVDSSNVDERTLRELYFKPFETAIKEGGVWAVMCAYNKINGTYCSENPFLLTQVLKTDWGFRGIVMSDWGAVHSTLGPLQAGLDLEMPGGEFIKRSTVQPLLDSGKVSMATIDDKVRRILRMTYAMQFDQRPQLDSSIPKDDPKNEAVSLQIAREGVVLLKNRNHLLPLNASKGLHILVLGPNASPAVTGGGGSAYTTPATAVSLLDAIKQQAGPNAQVVYHPLETDLVEQAMNFRGFRQPDNPTKYGLKREQWDNGMELTGAPTSSRTDRRIHIDLVTGGAQPVPQHFSVRWTANVQFDRSGEFLAASRSDDGIRVFLDDNKIIDDWTDHGSHVIAVPVHVEQGKTYKLRVEYFQDTGDAVAEFGFAPISGSLEKELPAAEVQGADVVIASFGFNPSLESEGQDRPFKLPTAQEMFLNRIVSLNPRTVVVNNSGSAVDMSGWVDKAGAIFQAWYPGGVGSTAIAEEIFGKTNPSGKLPMTFPKTLKDTYYAAAYPPVDHKIDYKEGLLMGYRWFDTKHVEPLFPFGFGLSYTSFKLSNLKSLSDVNTGVFNVTVSVKNTGDVAGAESVQAYVHATNSTVFRPEKELKAFGRVFLQPGETKEVTLPIKVKNLAYYRVSDHKWIVEPIQYDVAVGTSSRDLPLHATLSVKSWPNP